MKRLIATVLLGLLPAPLEAGGYLGSYDVNELVTFTVQTRSATTGAQTDADGLPTYQVYEDETGTPIATGTMALLNDAGTTGFYSEQITLTSAGSLYEKGKSYTIRVSAAVGGVTDSDVFTFQIGAYGRIIDGTGAGELDTNAGEVGIVADGIGVGEIATNAITAAEIASGAIGQDEIAADAITASEMGTDAIDAAAIAADAIGASEIATSAIDNTSFAAGAIGASAIAGDAIGSSELALTAVEEIADGTWDEPELGHTIEGTMGARIAITSGAADDAHDEIVALANLIGTPENATLVEDIQEGGGGGGESMPRVNELPDPGLIRKVPASATAGSLDVQQPIRVPAGAIDEVIPLDMSPLYGQRLVQTVGTPTISGGSIVPTAVGPHDWYAYVGLTGTATAGTYTVTVPVTMRWADQPRLVRFTVIVVP